MTTGNESGLPPCTCRDGSEPCPDCGQYVFLIDCNVWHDLRTAALVMLRQYEKTVCCHTVAGGRKFDCPRCTTADVLAEALGVERRDA